MIDLTHLQKLAEEGDAGAIAYLLKFTAADLAQADVLPVTRAALELSSKHFLESEMVKKGLLRIEIAEFTANLILEGHPKSEEAPNGAYYLASQKYECSVGKPRADVKKYYPSSVQKYTVLFT